MPYTKHGHSKGGKRTKELRAYDSILARCNNPTIHNFTDYGGRGIKCEYQSFEEFLADVGRAPTAEHSIERIDNKGNYCKGNCRWATPQEQANNRRSNRPLTFNGKTQNIKQWAAELGMSHQMISQRLQDGWSLERTLTEPNEGRYKFIEWNGETRMISEWAQKIGISRSALSNRFTKGWSIERALTTPKGSK